LAARGRWAELKRQFRAFVPAAQSKTLCATLQQWGASPDALQPLLRMIRAIVVSNAVHRAEMKRGKWAAGTLRAGAPVARCLRANLGRIR